MLKRTIAMLTLGLAALAFATPAQAGPKVGAQGVFALPTGDFGDIAGVGIGGLINVDYGIESVKGLQLTGRLGVIHFLGKEIDGPGGGSFDGPSQQHIPILVGMKYFFAPGVYGGLELGPNYVMVNDVEVGGITVEGDSELEFAATAGIGYMMKDLDLRAFMYLPSLTPEGDANAFDLLTIGLSAGYRFWAP